MIYVILRLILNGSRGYGYEYRSAQYPSVCILSLLSRKKPSRRSTCDTSSCKSYSHDSSSAVSHYRNTFSISHGAQQEATRLWHCVV
jgi:hypothetical protein